MDGQSYTRARRVALEWMNMKLSTRGLISSMQTMLQIEFFNGLLDSWYDAGILLIDTFMDYVSHIQTTYMNNL